MAVKIRLKFFSPALLELVDLRQFRRFAEASRVHRARLAAAIPANLLDAVVQLVRVAFRVGDVGMPVRARHVAADAEQLDVSLGEILRGTVEYY